MLEHGRVPERGEEDSREQVVLALVQPFEEFSLYMPWGRRVLEGLEQEVGNIDFHIKELAKGLLNCEFLV